MKLLPLLLLTAGCSTFAQHQPPPSDWPKLKIVVHRVPTDIMRNICAPLSPQPAACAYVYFAEQQCVIWLARNAPQFEEHERLHCAGWDHVGSTALRDAWQRHKTGRGSAP